MEVRLPSVSIGFPCNRDVPWQTMRSLLDTVRECAVRGVHLSFEGVFGSSVITTARSAVLDAFLKTNTEKLFWIDSDIVWKSADFFRLLALSTQLDVVCGAYPHRRFPLGFSICYPDSVALEANSYGCVKIEGTGLGFTIISRAVAEKLAANSPRRTDPIDGTEMAHVFRVGEKGEDLFFFDDVRAMGYDVWLDPSLQLGHVGAHVYSAQLVVTPAGAA